MPASNHNLVNRAGKWHCRVQVQGKTVWRSLKTGDIRLARQRRDALMAELTGDTGAQPEAAQPLGTAFEAYRQSIYAANTTEASIQAHGSALDAFKAWHGRPLAKMRDITGRIAYEYAEHLAAKGASNSTHNAAIGALARIWDVIEADCTAKGGAAPFASNVWAKLPRKTVRPVGRKPFTLAQVRALVDIAPTTYWRDAVLCGYWTGLRRGDVVLLHRDSIDLDRGIIEVTPIKTRRSGRKAIIAISPELNTVLAGCASTGYVFPELADQYNTNRHKIGTAFGKMCADIGLECKQDAGTMRKRAVYGFHSLRHGFRTGLLAQGVSETVVSLMMGHTLGRVRDTYTHAEGLLGQLHSAIGTLPTVMGGTESEQAFRIAG